jgi:1-acylglycerone phosphate reductase
MVLDSVFITGCSAGGIGSGIALEFQKQGLHVFATARDIQKLSHLKDLANVTVLSLDVTSQSSVEAAVEAVKSSKKGGGKLKYLINNAGLGLTTPIIHVDVDAGSDAREIWEVNYWGVLRVTKAFSELLIEGKGCIVNIGSGAGLVYWPWTGLSPYHFTKLSTPELTVQSECRDLCFLQSGHQPCLRDHAS